MCAAPGGKTSQIVQMTGGQAMVTACEPDRIRCDRLRSNMRRLGCERVNVMNIDARKLDDLLRFDRILLDAPCSGSGTIQLVKDHAAFSEKLVMNSSRLQKQLLAKACHMLKKCSVQLEKKKSKT
jgi:16S rRNA C967 or C1407 C5-methylase (RsmB/RsmF family)